MRMPRPRVSDPQSREEFSVKQMSPGRDHRKVRKSSARRSFPLPLPLLLAPSAPLGEGQGPQSGQSDLLVTRDTAAIRANLVPPDRRIDLSQLLLLLLNHREGETSLGRRAPPVRSWRVSRLELLLPLGQRPANLRQELLPSVRQEGQQLRVSGLRLPSLHASHRHRSPVPTDPGSRPARCSRRASPV